MEIVKPSYNYGDVVYPPPKKKISLEKIKRVYITKDYVQHTEYHFKGGKSAPDYNVFGDVNDIKKCYFS